MIVSPLYAIVDAETLRSQGIRLGDFSVELRDAGVRLVQYRDKVSGPQEVLQAAAEIAAVFEGVDATLILNDRADLAALAGWSGVHVGQGDLPVEAARAVLVPHSSAEGADEWATRVVGVSTHTDAQVREAEASGADYVAIGPVFGTSTKLDAEAVVGLEGVRAARALTRKPLVAIGGITLGNARSVVEAGADSVAVISGVFVEGRTVGEVVRDFLEILR
jgi:thiamine-phosphate pyrophosphorylase